MNYYDETVSISQTCEDIGVPQCPTDPTLRTSGLDCYLLTSLPVPFKTWPLPQLPVNYTSHITFKKPKTFMSVRPTL